MGSSQAKESGRRKEGKALESSRRSSHGASETLSRLCVLCVQAYSDMLPMRTHPMVFSSRRREEDGGPYSNKSAMHADLGVQTPILLT